VALRLDHLPETQATAWGPIQGPFLLTIFFGLFTVVPVSLRNPQELAPQFASQAPHTLLLKTFCPVDRKDFPPLVSYLIPNSVVDRPATSFTV